MATSLSTIYNETGLKTKPQAVRTANDKEINKFGDETLMFINSCLLQNVACTHALKIDSQHQTQEGIIWCSKTREH